MNAQSKKLTNVAIGIGLLGAALALPCRVLNAMLLFDTMSSETCGVWITSLNVASFIGGIMLMAMLMLLWRVSVCSTFAGVMGTIFLVISYFKFGFFNEAVYWLLGFPWFSVGLCALSRLLSKRKKIFVLCASMCMIGSWIIGRLVTNIYVQPMRANNEMLANNEMKAAMKAVGLVLRRLSLMDVALAILLCAAIGVIWVSRKQLAEQIKVVALTNSFCGRVKLAHLIWFAVMTAGFALLRYMNFFDSFLFLSIALVFLLAAVYFLAKSIAPFVDRVVEGRICRMQFFWLSLLVGGCSLVVNYLACPDRLTRMEFKFDPHELLCTLLTTAIWGICAFSIWVKRAHDIGWSSKLAIWMLVLAILPFFGCLDVFVDRDGGGMLFWPFYALNVLTLPILSLLLLFVPGTQGVNKSGERKDMSVQGRLASLKDLHDKGLMTDLEYEKKRKDILESI